MKYATGRILSLVVLVGILGSQALAAPILIDHFTTPNAQPTSATTLAPAGFNGAISTASLGGTREVTANVLAGSNPDTTIAFDVTATGLNGVATITSSITTAGMGLTNAVLVWDGRTTDGANNVTPSPGFGPVDFLTGNSSLDTLLSFTNPTPGAGSLTYTLYNANGATSSATATIPFTNGLFTTLSIPLSLFTGAADLRFVTAVRAHFTDNITTANPAGASYNIGIDAIQGTAVPEPLTMASALSGVLLLGLAALRRSRRNAA